MAEMYENTEWGHGQRPLVGANFNNAQHGGYYVHYSVNRPEQKTWTQGVTPPYHEVKVYDHEDDKVGNLQWHEDTGEILDIRVDPKHRRKGVATALLHTATQLSGQYGVPAPQQSADRSDQGDAWSKSLGVPLPKRRTLEDYQKAWGK